VTTASGSRASDVLRVVVDRSEPGAQATFEVARGDALVLLDVLVAVAAQDATLFFRFSCRSGFCGTCTVLLDGAPVLACQAPLPAGRTATLRVAPLGGFPVVRDLVVDPAPFAERWRSIGPAVEMDPDAGAGTGGRSLGDAAAIEGSLDCISCGACFAACDLSSLDSAFLGPAALTRAMVLVADARDTARAGRLASVAGPHGIEGCRGMGACSVACPKHLDPSRAIRRLRRWRLVGLP
jgi:succinate dehydrogenase/fumarate reductase iron-sulfur protein